MSLYFIADTHFNDPDIIRYENRPFTGVEEINETIIKNWNERVKPDDEIYHLGDVGENAQDIIAKLNGRKFLVKGNHDTRPNVVYRNMGFEEVYDHPIVLQNFFICSHEPIYVNMNMPYANIFGHVHNSPSYTSVSPRSHCVCVERIDYTPIELLRIRINIQKCIENAYE